MRVLLAQEIDAAGVDYLTERGYEVILASGSDEETLKREIVGMDAVIIRIQPFTAGILACADRLKVIGRHGVGVDNVDLEEAARRGIWVTNGPDSNVNSVAEHAVAMMLALCRKLPAADRAVRAGDFGFRNREVLADLEGLTLGILGFGNIGSRVALKCHFGFGMRVLAHNHREKPMPDYVEPVSFEQLLRRSDVLSLHLPSTPATRGCIGRAQLELMKPTALLLNTARGNIVVEQELAQALREGVIAGAGIDVYSQEPPPADHPFYALDNVVMTPHCSAHSKASYANMALHAAMGVHEVLAGLPVTWPVVAPPDKSGDVQQGS